MTALILSAMELLPKLIANLGSFQDLKKVVLVEEPNRRDRTIDKCNDGLGNA